MLVILSILLVIGTYIFIKFKNKNLINSAQFVFTIGLISTFVGFVLATSATDFQKDRDNKTKASSVLEATIDSNKIEMRLISVKCDSLELYTNKEIDEPILYSILVENNNLDIVNSNVELYQYYTNTFKTNLLLLNSYYKNLYGHYKSEGKNKDDLILLKELLGIKYLQCRIMEEELKYLHNDISEDQLKVNIKNISEEKLNEVLIKAMSNEPINNIVEIKYYTE